MAFRGVVTQHQRVDIRNAPQEDGATVLFLYSGLVEFQFSSPDDHTNDDTLEFDLPDGDLDETQISGRPAAIVTPIGFSTNDATAFMSVDNPRTGFFPATGRGLQVFARITVQNATLNRVAYQVIVHAKV
jgi:hypothetical protein